MNTEIHKTNANSFLQTLPSKIRMQPSSLSFFSHLLWTYFQIDTLFHMQGPLHNYIQSTSQPYFVFSYITYY